MSKWPLIGLTGCLVLAALAAGGVYFWLQIPRAVPEISLEGQEVEVADAVTEARDAVVKTPRSANAWGQLGRVLIANEIHQEIALVCFLEAERLDPEEPRWPYCLSAVADSWTSRPVVPCRSRSGGTTSCRSGS